MEKLAKELESGDVFKFGLNGPERVVKAIEGGDLYYYSRDEAPGNSRPMRVLDDSRVIYIGTPFTNLKLGDEFRFLTEDPFTYDRKVFHSDGKWFLYGSQPNEETFERWFPNEIRLIYQLTKVSEAEEGVLISASDLKLYDRFILEGYADQSLNILTAERYQSSNGHYLPLPHVNSEQYAGGSMELNMNTMVRLMARLGVNQYMIHPPANGREYVLDTEEYLPPKKDGPTLPYGARARRFYRIYGNKRDTREIKSFGLKVTTVSLSPGPYLPALAREMGTSSDRIEHMPSLHSGLADTKNPALHVQIAYPPTFEGELSQEQFVKLSHGPGGMTIDPVAVPQPKAELIPIADLQVGDEFMFTSFYPEQSPPRKVTRIDEDGTWYLDEGTESSTVEDVARWSSDPKHVLLLSRLGKGMVVDFTPPKPSFPWQTTARNLVKGDLFFYTDQVDVHNTRREVTDVTADGAFYSLSVRYPNGQGSTSFKETITAHHLDSTKVTITERHPYVKPFTYSQLKVGDVFDWEPYSKDGSERVVTYICPNGDVVYEHRSKGRVFRDKHLPPTVLGLKLIRREETLAVEEKGTLVVPPTDDPECLPVLLRPIRFDEVRVGDVIDWEPYDGYARVVIEVLDDGRIKYQVKDEGEGATTSILSNRAVAGLRLITRIRGGDVTPQVPLFAGWGGEVLPRAEGMALPGAQAPTASEEPPSPPSEPAIPAEGAPVPEQYEDPPIKCGTFAPECEDWVKKSRNEYPGRTTLQEVDFRGSDLESEPVKATITAYELTSLKKDLANAIEEREAIRKSLNDVLDQLTNAEKPKKAFEINIKVTVEVSDVKA